MASEKSTNSPDSHSTWRSPGQSWEYENSQTLSPVYRFFQIQDETIKILNIGSLLLPSEIKRIKDFKTLDQVLLYLRNFQSNQHSTEQRPHQKAIKNASNLSEVKELKAQLKEKREVIIALTEGYREARAYFDEDLREKQQMIAQLKKQNILLKKQTQIAIQKMRKVQKTPNQGNYLKKQCSIDSQKSDYQELKDMLELMTNKIQNLQREAPVKISSTRNSLILPKSSSSMRSSNQTLSFIQVRNKMYSPGSQELLKEVRQLKESQSKLLDKIYQRDSIISQLLQCGSNKI